MKDGRDTASRTPSNCSSRDDNPKVMAKPQEHRETHGGR